MSIFNLFTLFGGLALFLFGMDIMGKSLEKQAGNRLSKILSKLTSSPFRGFLLGLSVTAIIQSSSATTVMVVGFVNSGIMNLRQAIGIIMGSNVGTTVTAWLLSLTGIQGDSFLIQLFKPSSFSPLLAFIGIVLYMSGKNEKKKNIGTIMLGFAILMTGMETMSGAVKPLAQVPEFANILTSFSNPILGLLMGTLLTALLQSSSASVGILQALSTTGAITFGSALPIIMGQNIGTCITAIISSVGANKNAKRAAAVHLYFNLIGAASFMLIFYGLNSILHFEFVNSAISVTGIAVVHTLFNVTATAVMLPFSGFLEKLAVATIKDDTSKEEFQILDSRLLNTPAIAVEHSKKLIGEMETLSLNGFATALGSFNSEGQKDFEQIISMEKTVDKYEDSLGTYLVKLSGQDLSASDSHEISKMLHIIGDFERISDYSVAVAKTAMEMRDKEIEFSPQAQSELSVLTSAMDELITKTHNAFKTDNSDIALEIEPLQQLISRLIRQIKDRHIERLQNKNCTIELGFVLSDLLNSCDRVAGHCSNIAVAVIEAKHNSFAPHEYLRNYRQDENSSFKNIFEAYSKKYFL